MKFFAYILIFIPGIASAATLNSFVTDLYNSLGKAVIPFLVTLALAVFFWRIVVSLYKVGNSPEEVQEGKNLLLWGIVILFVMISIWGITSFIGRSLGIRQGIPQLGGGQGGAVQSGGSVLPAPRGF